MSKHRSGGKITRTHTSLTPAAEQLVDAAEKCDEVSKVSLGIIKSGIRGGEYRLKITEINGGLKATVRSPTSIQEVFIYTKHPERTKKTLEELR